MRAIQSALIIFSAVLILISCSPGMRYSSVEEMQLPRGVLGMDYRFENGLYLAVDYHYNGLGTLESSKYVERALLPDTAEPPYTRGEVFLLGQHYLLVFTQYELHPLLNGGLIVMGKLTDPSVVLSPTLTLSFAQDVELIAGAYLGLGKQPTGLELGSEFGTYPFVYFAQMSCYW